MGDGKGDGGRYKRRKAAREAKEETAMARARAALANSKERKRAATSCVIGRLRRRAPGRYPPCTRRGRSGPGRGMA